LKLPEDIKIVAFPGDHGGGGYYRIISPLKKLANYGYKIVISDLIYKEIIDWADILYFQRHTDKHILEQIKYAKENKKIILYDVDDYFHDIPLSNPCWQIIQKGSDTLKMLETIMGECDYITVSTERLKKEYEKYNKNIHVFENYIDFYNVPPYTKNDDSFVRIIWTGSSTHNDDFGVVFRVLCSFLKENNKAKFVTMGTPYSMNLVKYVNPNQLEYFEGTYGVDKAKKFSVFNGLYKPAEISSEAVVCEQDFYNLENNNIKYILRKKNGESLTADLSKGFRDDVESYYRILSALRGDIGIAPLTMCTFNECKSSIKLEEYSSFSIPFIASPSSAYKKYSKCINFDESRKNGIGFLAETNSDWKKCLKFLYDNREAREEIGVRGYNYVKNNYNLNDKIKERHEFFLSIMNHQDNI
jgi:hypothetical protein